LRTAPETEPEVFEVVMRHVDAAAPRKAGGVLVGRVLDDVATVDAAIPIDQAEEHDGEVAFPPEVWGDVYTRLSRDFGGAKIVGWYHSHPGEGATMSRYDERLHATLFSEPSMMALVVDPASGDAGWYGWVIGRLAPIGAAEVEAAPEDAPPAAALEAPPAAAAVEAPPRPPRGTLLRRRVAVLSAVGVALAVLAYVLGAVISGGPSDDTSALSRDLAASRTEAARLRAEQQSLTNRLEAARQQLRLSLLQLAETRTRLVRTQKKLGQVESMRLPKMVVLTYTVRPGDSMWRLAQFFYGSGNAWPRIQKPNHLANPNVLLVGQRLKIPIPLTL
jgi:proteasome lid subunit RPN8/RPN11